ncbi:MAG: B12-binding domain-containing radical SAM protein [Candidatus Gastranaerophilales bacterium]|nr:B12-binding domain-containing radical SAM protein [Candidatus Gastranaerophilales bacterium]
MIKVMLIYPPGEIYQRGEDRCQINVEASVSNALRACNDLGYIASGLKKFDCSIFLKDYPAEKKTFVDLKQDISSFLPDVVFISITNGSIYNDLKIVKEIKDLKNDVVIILKGALFFNPDKDLFDELDLINVDYLIGGEAEFIVPDLIKYHFTDKNQIKNIQGISYKEDNKWYTNDLTDFADDLDSIPFPDRSLMNNKLYINPATNRPLATISTSRGCPSSCIYCVSPVISGKKVRFRDINCIFEEIKECVKKYNITDFFFKSDTFTIKKDWVIELCNLIINSELKGKINWAANSRVNTIDEEMLLKMKQAGCSIIALGLESGSNDSLKKMKKGTTVEQNETAVKLIKKAGMKIFGFYLIGFPWETEEHLRQTKEFIFKADTDFIELSIAVPFKGSELYSMVFDKLNCGEKVLGKDSFKYVTLGTDYISNEELEKFRKDLILKYHLRPSYIFKKIFSKNLTPSLFFNYVKYGLRMIRNLF